MKQRAIWIRVSKIKEFKIKWGLPPTRKALTPIKKKYSNNVGASHTHRSELWLAFYILQFTSDKAPHFDNLRLVSVPFSRLVLRSGFIWKPFFFPSPPSASRSHGLNVALELSQYSGSSLYCLHLHGKNIVSSPSRHAMRLASGMSGSTTTTSYSSSTYGIFLLFHFSVLNSYKILNDSLSHYNLQIIFYLPIQNLLKISFTRSSSTDSPIIFPSSS